MSASGESVRQLREESKLRFTVWICRQVGTAVVQSDNTVLCAQSLLEHTYLTVMMNNKALICRRNWTSSAEKHHHSVAS